MKKRPFVHAVSALECTSRSVAGLGHSTNLFQQTGKNPRLSNPKASQNRIVEKDDFEQ
jgi:hypothetical protein